MGVCSLPLVVAHRAVAASGISQLTADAGKLPLGLQQEQGWSCWSTAARGERPVIFLAMAFPVGVQVTSYLPHGDEANPALQKQQNSKLIASECSGGTWPDGYFPSPLIPWHIIGLPPSPDCYHLGKQLQHTYLRDNKIQKLCFANAARTNLSSRWCECNNPTPGALQASSRGISASCRGL